MVVGNVSFKTLLMMCGFYIAGSFMKAIGQNMSSTSLLEIWVESSVWAVG